MRLQRIYNQELVRGILTDPEIWYTFAEDGSEPDDFFPDLNTVPCFAIIDEVPLGFMFLRDLSYSVCEVQVVLPPEQWSNKEIITAVKGAIEVVLENYVPKVVASVPQPDKQVLRFYQRIGFQREGINKLSFVRDGELYNQYYVGMTRE